MERALARYRVAGVKTNLDFLQTIVTHPVFRAGQVTTDFLDTQFDAEAVTDAPDEAMIAALGALLIADGQPDPWLAAGPIGAGGVARLDIEHDGNIYVLLAQRAPGDRHLWNVAVNRGQAHNIRFTRAAGDHILVEHDGKTTSARVSVSLDGIDVTSGGRRYEFAWTSGDRVRSVADHRPHGLMAPMPGLVLKVLVKPGDHVRAHQTLIVLEAMKMEHSIEAPHDGVVKAVHCAEGGRVAEGQLLVDLEQEAKEDEE
jgi:3-methylcrotonyl-CoA carboxylase alpha subunit